MVNSLDDSKIIELFYEHSEQAIIELWMQKTERGSENEGRRTPPFEPHKRPVCRFYRMDG